MDGSFLVLAGLVGIAFLILAQQGADASTSPDQSGGTGTAPAPSGNSGTGGIDNVPDPGSPSIADLHLTNDPNTWPTGDRVWDVCRAIAYAEGAHIAGSVPDRFNNPGDISDGAKQFSQTFTFGSNVTMFPDKATGWQWLYSKVFNMASGQSSVFRPDMTWTQVAQKWAGNWQNWVNNVTAHLGVSPNSTVNDYIGFQPVSIQ